MSSLGKRYHWVARHARFMGRYRQIVTVLAWHGHQAVVHFPDGWIAGTPGRCLRKLLPPSRQLPGAN